MSDLVFTPDSQYLAADWNDQRNNSGGFAGYEMVQGRFILNELSSIPTVGLQTANDATGDYAFWVTFDSAHQVIFLTVVKLSTPTHLCTLDHVPSNSFTLSMSGGIATINFGGIPTPSTWYVNGSTCAVTH
jgi:hypothetical protein